NHFCGARLQGRDLSLERFPDSAYRDCRLRDRLLPHNGSITEDNIKEALQDSFGHPNAVCRHADPAQQALDQLETVASIVGDTNERRFLVAKGAPDRNAYTEFTVADLERGRVGVAA